MDGIIAYILSKKYTNDTVIGMGAIKGAACQVQSINKVNKTTTVTLEWEDNLGTSHTQSFDIEDGLDGVSVTGATIKPDGHLELTLSNGTTIDCGKVLPQYDTIPTPSASNEGQILQYIGTTTSSYTNGYFYQCINDGGVYKWVEKSVQDSYTKIQIGDLSDLPDNTKNVIENIADIKLSVDQLSASKLSISDIDNALSDVSENPVQNKVIKLTLDQLRGSILDKLDEKEDKFRYSTMPTASVDYLNKIVEYIGTTDSTYTNGYFYQCRFDGINYSWVQKNIQPSSGGTGGDGVVDGYYNTTDHLFYEEAGYINPISGDNNTLYVSLDTNLLYRYNGLIFIRVDESTSGEDDVIDGYYNTTDHKFYEEPTYVTEITGQTGKIYISDDTNIQYRWDGTQFVTISSSIVVDNALSTTSENPVQNKVISLKIQDLEASKLSISDIDNALSNVSENPVQNKVIKQAIDNLDLLLASKVDKETGKGLSTNDFTDADKDKLRDLAPIYLIGSGLSLNPTDGTLSATGISIQVDPTLDNTSTHPIQNQAVANAIDLLQASKLSISDIDNTLSTTSENPVQNKVISLAIDQLQGSVLQKIQKKLSATADNFVAFDNGGDIKDSGISTDIVPSTASVSNKLLVASDLSVKADKVSGATNDDIALLDSTGNLKDSNKKLSDYQEKLTDGNGINIDTSNNISLDITYLTASRVGYIPATEKGSNNGVAELDNAGKVPSSQLPSYVDDVIEGYLDSGNFYKDAGHTQLITPEDGKIYVNLADNTTYRWGGTAYVQISSSVALGTTHTTAYYGDLGQTAYNHSQIINGSNPHNTTADNVNLKVPIPALSGSKLDVESTLYGINTALGTKADKVASATSGNFAGLDANGNLTDSGSKASDFLTSSDITGKADKVSGAINGDLAGLDSNGNLTDSGVVASKVIQKVTTATGLLKDDGTVDTTSYAPANKAYLTDDTTDTTIDNADYVPFYDTSATTKKRLTWTNIKAVLKSYFDGLYTGNTGTVTSVGSSDGLTGGAITTTGTLKANLRDYTKLTNDSSAATETANRVYPVALDKSGYLSVNVPWTDNNTWNANALNVAGYVAAPTSSNANMVWKCDGSGNPAWRGDSNTIPSAYCDTAAGTAAKTASCSGYSLLSNSYLHVVVVNSNSSASALTLNVNGKGAKSIYINGSASSATNYSLPAGSYLVYYDGTNYYFRTDGALTTKGAYNINPTYGSYNINSQMTTTRRLTKEVAAGSTGVGVWDDTTTESGWWQSDYFKFPATANSKNIDISFKFDPEYGSNEVVALTGYILDTTTGKLCLRFGSAISNAQLIAVDITYTPTYS